MSSATGSKPSSGHESASAGVVHRDILTITPNILPLLFSDLDLYYAKNDCSVLETEAGALFRDFFKENVNAFDSEKALENSLRKTLSEIMMKLDGRRLVEQQRTLDDLSRTDIIVSRVNETPLKDEPAGRPAILFELKSPTLKSLDLKKHKFQLVHYVRELLGRHVSVERLPFVLFNGYEYYVGLAIWLNYSRLRIEFDSTKYVCKTPGSTEYSYTVYWPNLHAF